MTTSTTVLRIGTRASRLALAQAEAVAHRIRAVTGERVELVEITTEGDRSRAALAAIGGQGVFVGAVREALAARRCDIAVHSLKDLPVGDDPRVRLCAVPAREDPRDVLVARDGARLATLPKGSVIGTGSPRRAAQLLALDRAFDVVPVRGNVDTRLRLVAESRVDAVVLALAGLARLGRSDEATEVIDPQIMLPAPGQGALAVEVSADSPLGDLLAQALDDPDTRCSVTAERAVLAALGAGCSAPIGALAVVETAADAAASVHLRALAAAPDGSRVLTRSADGPPERAAELGRQVAAQLLDAGADDLARERVP